MERKTLTEILRNPHFNQFASIFSVAMAPGWRMRHPDFPSVRATLESLARHVKDSSPFDKTKFVEDWTRLIVSLTVADPGLSYSTEDMEWFATTLDSEDVNVTLSMLFAVASAPVQWLTLEQVAELTGLGMSTWRKRVAAGEVAGAHLAGKTWIVPALSLRAYGYDAPSSLQIEVEDS